MAVPPEGCHRYVPVVAEELSTTLPPAQKVVGPPGVITGTAGVGFTVTTTVFETAEVHPAAITVTLNEPEAVITLVCATPGPGFQTFPFALDEVSVVLPPEQNVIGPTGVMEGVAGVGFTVTTTGAETAEVQPPATA